MNYGVARFMPIECLDDPNWGVGRDARKTSLVEEYISGNTPKRQTVTDWPKVCEAICRGNQFVVELSTPTFKAMLRFFTDKPDAGDFEIHYQHPHRIKKGRTLKVIAVPSDETQEPVSLLVPYEYRYAIITADDDRSKARNKRLD